MFTFLLVVHAIIAAALVAVILMQRSEGGGLGVGGSPSGLMSARGAADFLTRATTILASLFVLMSIGLAALATVERAPRTIDTSLARQPSQSAPVPGAPSATPGAVPLEGDPLAIGGNAAAPVPAPAVPIAPARPAVEPAEPARARDATPVPAAQRAPAREPASARTPVGNPAVSNFSLQNGDEGASNVAPAPAGD